MQENVLTPSPEPKTAWRFSTGHLLVVPAGLALGFVLSPMYSSPGVILPMMLLAIGLHSVVAARDDVSRISWLGFTVSVALYVVLVVSVDDYVIKIGRRVADNPTNMFGLGETAIAAALGLWLLFFHLFLALLIGRISSRLAVACYNRFQGRTTKIDCPSSMVGLACVVMLGAVPCLLIALDDSMPATFSPGRSELYGSWFFISISTIALWTTCVVTLWQFASVRKRRCIEWIIGLAVSSSIAALCVSCVAFLYYGRWGMIARWFDVSTSGPLLLRCPAAFFVVSSVLTSVVACSTVLLGIDALRVNAAEALEYDPERTMAIPAVPKLVNGECD